MYECMADKKDRKSKIRGEIRNMWKQEEGKQWIDERKREREREREREKSKLKGEGNGKESKAESLKKK